MVQIRKHPPKTPKQAVECCSPLDGALSAHFFKALSDPTRLLLLSCLAKCNRPCSVTEVSECCSVDISVVSRHLAILANAGILTSSKEGRVVSYQVEFSELTERLRSLASAFEGCCVVPLPQTRSAHGR